MSLGILVVSTSFVTVIGTIFQCRPVSFAWDKTLDGKCFDVLAFERFTAIPNVVTGLLMLVLPLPIIWRLNVAPVTKVALTATFLHGIM